MFNRCSLPTMGYVRTSSLPCPWSGNNPVLSDHAPSAVTCATSTWHTKAVSGFQNLVAFSPKNIDGLYCIKGKL